MYSTRYSCSILMKLEFSRQFSKNTEISNFMKIRPVGAELFHADRRTDEQTRRSEQSLFAILRTRLYVIQGKSLCLFGTHKYSVGRN